MRIIKDIPNPHCKISVFQMNQKYIVKVERGNLEQSYKISELDLFNGLDDIGIIFNDEMIQRIMLRFREMENDLGDALASL